MFWNQSLVWPCPRSSLSRLPCRPWRQNHRDTPCLLGQGRRGGCGDPKGAEPNLQASSGLARGGWASGAGHTLLLRCCQSPQGATGLMQPGGPGKAGLSWAVAMAGRELCRPAPLGTPAPKEGPALGSHWQSPDPTWGPWHGEALSASPGPWGPAELPGPWTSRPHWAPSDGESKLTRPLGPALPLHLGNWSPKAEKCHGDA